MYYATETDSNETNDICVDHNLVLDGTVSLEDNDEDSIPRVRGLIEIFNDFLGD